MATQLTVGHARESLNIHVEAKGREIFAKFGPALGWEQLLHLMADRTQVRYPCEIVFDATHLQPGEFAHPMPKGDRPEDGFTVQVHPHFLRRLDQVPALVLYQLVLVNYGDFASTDDAETFGATALGITKDEYYQMLCELADGLEHGCPAV